MAESALSSYDVLKFDGDFFIKSQLRPEEVLDTGMCGEIVLACLPERPNVKFVVKKFSLLDKDKLAINKRKFKRETKFMQSLDHPFVAKRIYAVKCPEYLAICMRYYHRQTLDVYVGDLDLDMSEMCTLQVACALRYLHKKIVHLDVKLDNIFIDNEHNAILGDFGLAAEVPPDQVTLPRKNIGGTVGYLSPEWIAATHEVQLDPYKIDSFGLGVVLWSLAFQRGPDENVHYYFETRKNRDLQPHIRDILLRLLERDPAKRISVTDLLHRVRRDSAHRHVIDNNKYSAHKHVIDKNYYRKQLWQSAQTCHRQQLRKPA